MTRYPRYKDSGVTWLGDIPEGWDLKYGKCIFTENKLKNKALDQKTILSLSYGKIVVKESPNEGLVPAEYSSYQVLAVGDIVIRCTDLQNDQNSLRVGFVENPGIITSAYLGLKINHGFFPRFVFYYLHTWDISKEIYRYGSGLRQSLSWEDLKYLPCLLPPLPEQEAIVKYLDETTGKIDKAIAAEERLIELLQERRQIIINEAVGGGNLSRAETQRRREWEVTRFKSLFSTCTGISFTKAEIVEEGCPVLSYGQIHSKDNFGVGVNSKLIRHIPVALTSEKALAHKGDFLFADTSEDLEGCGNCICIDTEEPIYAGSHVILARKQHGEMGRFLAYEFASSNWRTQLRKLVNGVKVYSITQTILNSVPVWLPPLPEQEAIVERLDRETGRIDRAIEVKRRQIALLRERREIIIDEVVTGKVRVVQHPAKREVPDGQVAGV